MKNIKLNVKIIIMNLGLGLREAKNVIILSLFFLLLDFLLLFAVISLS